jgi:hypothetical protein
MRQFPPLAARMDKVKQGIEQLTLLLRAYLKSRIRVAQWQRDGLIAAP